MLIKSYTILILDILIIIIIKYCINNIKYDDDFVRLIKSKKYFEPIPINRTKSNKLIIFLLEQLNYIYKSKEFKTLKSLFIKTDKTYPIANTKDWLYALYILLDSSKTNITKGLFSNHFKIDTKIKDLDLTKGYRSCVNLISKFEKTSLKYDLKESNNIKLSIIFNLLFYPLINIKNGGGKSPTKSKKLNFKQAVQKVIQQRQITKSNIATLQKGVKDKELVNKIIIIFLAQTINDNNTRMLYNSIWETFFKTINFKEVIEKFDNFIRSKQSTLSISFDKEIYIMLLYSWTDTDRAKYIQTFGYKQTQTLDQFNRFIDNCWEILERQLNLTTFSEITDPRRRYCILLTQLTNKFFTEIKESLPEDVKLFFGTDQFVINSIIQSKCHLLPQSASFDIESASQFLGSKAILGIYDFNKNKENQLYIPVSISILSLYGSTENETLLIPSTINLTEQQKRQLQSCQRKQFVKVLNLEESLKTSALTTPIDDEIGSFLPKEVSIFSLNCNITTEQSVFLKICKTIRLVKRFIKNIKYIDINEPFSLDF
tara:strand:- start:789 stop:2417 length:1629 start_codon:yes stop_codon:yes gene_type:complete